MPLYDFQCNKCGDILEIMLSLAEYEDAIRPGQSICSCGGDLHQILVKGHGTNLDDHPLWINDHVRGALQDFSIPRTKPIETRTHLKRFLKENPNVRPKH